MKNNKKFNRNQQEGKAVDNALTLGAGGSPQNIPHICNWPRASQICRFWYTAETDGAGHVGDHFNSSNLRLVFKYILQTRRLRLLK